MTKYLIDTDILIDHLRKRRFFPLNDENSELYISIITKAELVFGAYKLKNKKQEVLRNIELLLYELDIKVISVDEKVIYKFAEIKSELEVKGKPLADFDLLIASTAIAYNLPLVSRNIKHYQRIKELKLIHP